MKVTDDTGPITPVRNKLISCPSRSRDLGQTRQHAGGDQVTLSDTAAAVVWAAERIKHLPAVDMDKVTRIKAMLRDGTYTADADKAAAGMLTEALLKDE